MSTTGRAFLMVGLFTVLIGIPWHTPLVMGAACDLHVAPNTIYITESFRGATINITAQIPKAAEAVVEITGPAHDVRLLRKGRRGGLWMSVGEVEVKGAPSVYLLADTARNPPAGPGSDAEWGYHALAKRVTFVGAVPSDEKSVLFGRFAKLQESLGLYGIFPGALKVSPAGEGRSKVEGRIVLPGNMAPGEYKVTLSVFKEGKLVTRQSLPLVVEMKGLAAFLTDLANDHGVLYGLLAVGIALVMGFVMGFVFKGKGAH
jgi:uncharacterized protein (TIGR02186 family)